MMPVVSVPGDILCVLLEVFINNIASISEGVIEQFAVCCVHPKFGKLAVRISVHIYQERALMKELHLLGHTR